MGTQQAPELAVRARGITKAYQTGTVSTPVLHGVDLDVPTGECLFLVGPSGSGKTTLLSILGCVLSPDEGTLQILGENAAHWKPKNQARFRRERIGFLFQRYHLFEGLKAWENVRVAFDLLGYSPKIGRSESFRLLERVGLAERAKNRIGQLSMGQRQRVALARALAGNPDVLLADEPTAALDAETGQTAMGLMHELSRKLCKTVIVVTHDTRIFSLADRILKLVDGRVGEEAQTPAAPDRHGTDVMTPVSTAMG